MTAKKQYRIVARGTAGELVKETNSEEEAEQIFEEMPEPKFLYNHGEMEQYDSGLLENINGWF